MRLTVNGRPHDAPDDCVLTAVVTDVVADPRGCAVAVNGRVVPRADWTVTGLRAGDLVEVVTATQGG